VKKSIVPFLQSISDLGMTIDIETESLLTQLLTLQVVPRRTKIITVGQVPNAIYFVLKGCVRKYFFKNDSFEPTEVNSLFFIENDFFSIFDCFFKQQPSLQVLESVEPCRLLSLSYENYRKLLTAKPLFFNELTARFMIEQYANMKDVHSTFLLLNPEERYENFIQNSPHLSNRISQKYLAGYLGVSEKSLSRIKKRIYNKG